MPGALCQYRSNQNFKTLSQWTLVEPQLLERLLLRLRVVGIAIDQKSKLNVKSKSRSLLNVVITIIVVMVVIIIIIIIINNIIIVITITLISSISKIT
jgi:uncharacterized Tic20 family protein